MKTIQKEVKSGINPDTGKQILREVVPIDIPENLKEAREVWTDEYIYDAAVAHFIASKRDPVRAKYNRPKTCATCRAMAQQSIADVMKDTKDLAAVPEALVDLAGVDPGDVDFMTFQIAIREALTKASCEQADVAYKAKMTL